MVSPTPLPVPPLPRLSQRDSAFTKVTACTLAKSPCDPLHQRLQQFRCLHYCSDCYRVERTSSRTGLTPAVDHHLFTAHPACPLYDLVRLSAAEVSRGARIEATEGLRFSLDGPRQSAP